MVRLKVRETEEEETTQKMGDGEGRVPCVAGDLLIASKLHAVRDGHFP